MFDAVGDFPIPHNGKVFVDCGSGVRSNEGRRIADSGANLRIARRAINATTERAIESVGKLLRDDHGGPATQIHSALLDDKQPVGGGAGHASTSTLRRLRAGDALSQRSPTQRVNSAQPAGVRHSTPRCFMSRYSSISAVVSRTAGTSMT